MDDETRNSLALILGQNARTHRRADGAEAIERFLTLLADAKLAVVSVSDAGDPLAGLRAAALRALFKIIGEARQGANFPYLPTLGEDIYHRDLIGILVSEGLAVEVQGLFVLTHSALSLLNEVEGGDRE